MRRAVPIRCFIGFGSRLRGPSGCPHIRAVLTGPALQGLSPGYPLDRSAVSPRTLLRCTTLLKFTSSPHIALYLFAGEKKDPLKTGLFYQWKRIGFRQNAHVPPIIDHVTNPHQLHDHPCLSPKLFTNPESTHILMSLTPSMAVVGTAFLLAVVGTATFQVVAIFLSIERYGLGRRCLTKQHLPPL